jgi:hypothetical protein
MAGFSVMTNQNLARYLGGWASEFAIYDNLVSDINVGALETYAAAKWAI